MFQKKNRKLAIVCLFRFRFVPISLLLFFFLWGGGGAVGGNFLGVLGYLLGVLGYLLQWRSHLLGVLVGGRSDEWKSGCNFPPAGGKMAPPSFYDGLGVPMDWASRWIGRSR